MVVIWHGRGIIVLFIFILAAIAAIILTVMWIAPALSMTDRDRTVNLAIAVSTFISAIALYPFCRLVMKPRPTAIDTFCFIDMRYWPHIFMILTAIMLAVVIFS